MGFSVSGAAAIVFTGMFIAFSMWYGASYNSFERISEAQQDRSERVLDTRNVDLEIETATHAEETLTVEVDNTGATAVALESTDVLVDNEYRTGWREAATVAGDADTEVWQPGERLHVAFDAPEMPTQVKVATEQGVADTAGVTTA